MDNVVACLMLEITGKEKTLENFRVLYKAIGAEFEEDACNAFIKKINNQNINEIMDKGNEIIQSMASKVVSAQPAATSAVEEKPKVEEQKEEEVVEISLFDDMDF